MTLCQTLNSAGVGRCRVRQRRHVRHRKPAVLEADPERRRSHVVRALARNLFCPRNSTTSTHTNTQSVCGKKGSFSGSIVAVFRLIQPATPVVSACTCDSATGTVTTHGSRHPGHGPWSRPTADHDAGIFDTLQSSPIIEIRGGNPRLQSWIPDSMKLP